MLRTKLVVFKLSKRVKHVSGRNNTGRITVRHKVGGRKRRFRILDSFHRKNIPGLVRSTTILPRRFSFASIFEHSDISYSLFPSSEGNPSKLLPCTSSLETPSPHHLISTRLKFIKKVGFRCFNVQFSKSNSSQIATSPGTSVKILRQGLLNYIVRMPSGEIRRLSPNVFCFLGQLRSPYKPRRSTLAGFSYLMGTRPAVRGVAMNPVDHPHGGNTSPGKNSVSPWAKFSKAKYNSTRNFSKASSSIILYRRYIKKKF